MAEQYIFTIENLSKAYGKRDVGKSTLLRVMALVEKDFIGGVRPADGIAIGYVPQEPRLDETKDVMGNLEEAVAKTRALLKRYEDLSSKLAEPLEPDVM